MAEEEPAILDNLARRELDETCEKLHWIMVMRRAYEPDKLRYNALYKESERFLGLSKPTFETHMKHLASKKLVIRQRAGKQEVYFYLNKDDSRIRRERELLEDIRKEGDQLLSLMKKPDFWESLPPILARFDTVCNLKRWKLMITPGGKKEKILGLVTAYWYQQRIQEKLMVNLLVAMKQSPSEADRIQLQNRLLKTLEEAAKQEERALSDSIDDLETRISGTRKGVMP